MCWCRPAAAASSWVRCKEGRVGKGGRGPPAAGTLSFAEAMLLGDARSSVGESRGDQRVVGRKPPFLAIAVDRQVMGRLQMALHHPQLRSAFQADDMEIGRAHV